MSKLVLMALLALISGSALAEWVKIGGNDVATSYADPARVQRSGNTVKIWGLLDFKTMQQDSVDKTKIHLSEVTQLEFDCRKPRGKVISYSLHAGNMGGGVVVRSSSTPEKWSPVSPETAMSRARQFACAKR